MFPAECREIHTTDNQKDLFEISYIPMDNIKCPRRPVIHVLSSEKIRALFSEIDAYKPSRPSCGTLRISKEYPVLFRLMLTTGLRRSEAVSIRIQDFDVNEHTIMIRNNFKNFCFITSPS